MSSRPEAAAPPLVTPGAAGPGARPRPSWLVWVALGIVYVVWGSTYLAIRVVVETVPPLLGMGLRFGLAGLLLAGVVVARGGSGRLRVTRRQAASAAVVGVFLLLGGNGMVAVAEQEVPSGLAALVIAAVPLWVVVLRWLGRDRPAPVTLLGVLLGFPGLVLLLLPTGRPAGVPLDEAGLRPGAAVVVRLDSGTVTARASDDAPSVSVDRQIAGHVYVEVTSAAAA